MEWSIENAPIGRRHSLQETTLSLSEQSITLPLIEQKQNLACDAEGECKTVRFFLDSAEGELMKTVEIEGSPTCTELISLLLEKYSSLLNTEGSLSTEFQLVMLSHEGETILSPDDQPISISNTPEIINFLLKDNRKFDRKSNPPTSDSMLKLTSFFSGDYKSNPNSSSNYSLVSTMSSDSSSTNNTGGSTPMLNAAKPFLTPVPARKASLGSQLDQERASTLGRNKSYSKSKGNQLRKNISFGAIMRWKGKKKEFDDFEVPPPIRKFSTMPPVASIDEYEHPDLFISIHVCVRAGSEERRATRNLLLTHDLTVDKVIGKLLIMEGVPTEEHDSYGLYEVPTSKLDGSISKCDRPKSLAWVNDQDKRLDGAERLIALYTLSKANPDVERRFELKKHSSVPVSSTEQNSFNKRYRAVNFGEDFYTDVESDNLVENECILDPPQVFSNEPTNCETVTTEIEKPEDLEFTGESSFVNREARQEEINNLLDLHKTPHEYPFLLTLRSYPILTSLLIHLNDNIVYIGSEFKEGRLTDDSTFVSIEGTDIKQTHCRISFSSHTADTPHLLMHIEPVADAKVLVNGKQVKLSTKVNPGDLIQLGDKFLFMYRNPAFEYHFPDYSLNWTAQLNESLPQSDVTQLHSTPKPILGENTVEKFRLDYVSETNLQNLNSTSVYSDDGFCSIDTLSPSEKNSIIFNLSNFDNLINAVTKNFDISAEKGKLIPACMLSQGFLHSQKKEDFLALNFFNRASSSIASAIKTSVAKLILIKTDYIFPSQALNVFESVSNELESAFLWLNNGLEFVTYPSAYFANTGEKEISKELKQHVSSLETVISEGINKTMEFFLKLLHAPLAGLLDENHVLLSLSPSSTCTETSGYISSSTSTNSRSSPTMRHASTHNPNVDIVNDLLQVFYKTLHDTYTSTELIPEIFTNLFARIKKFLSNFIFEHGEELGLYSQIRGQQMKWCVGQIEQWANRTGLREQYDTPSSCLKSILILLSTPGEELVKLDWNMLRKEHPLLSPPQLHHILLHYILPGIPGLQGLPGSISADYFPSISLVITPEHWRPSITEADSAFNHANIKERGYLPTPFSFPPHPHFLLPDNIPSDIPFDHYVDRLLAGFKDKLPMSPESYDSSSNTVSPIPDIMDLDSSQDEYVTHRRFSSFDDIIGSSDFDSSFSSTLGHRKSMDFLRSSVDNDFYPELDNDRFGFTSQHNKNSSVYPPLLDRPKSLDCLHRHTKSDNLTYEAGYGISDLSTPKYEVSFSSNQNTNHKSPVLGDHQLKITHSPQIDRPDNKYLDPDLLDLLGTPEASSESETDLTPNSVRKQMCRTTLRFEIKPFLTPPLQPHIVDLTDDSTSKSEDDDDISVDSRGTTSTISKIKLIKITREPTELLGLELVKGESTKENIPGIYIKSIATDSPASQNSQLAIGYKILSINHRPLDPSDIDKAKELILSSQENILLRVLPCNRHF